ncbi:MAG: hypothetical protein CL859_01250 [Cyanobium sp. ARS6]|nr:hypothetical protein [Cyanobium sp. ARS6]
MFKFLTVDISLFSGSHLLQVLLIRSVSTNSIRFVSKKEQLCPVSLKFRKSLARVDQRDVLIICKSACFRSICCSLID